eukprot:CAMPEP_0174974628 /NCGR_PEP_ID=MMETSP0004_2-20121128/11955_1 /TAXON_ID=420556 /ORGANISM="Ochromonas sp., Strain CCMP1393" /LENGTH=584 /DNA_ID=CAMNT_0016225313 /DNA_START=99 /DNA_END=1854 /DNA_ORIENTATION=-
MVNQEDDYSELFAQTDFQQCDIVEQYEPADDSAFSCGTSYDSYDSSTTGTSTGREIRKGTKTKVKLKTNKKRVRSADSNSTTTGTYTTSSLNYPSSDTLQMNENQADTSCKMNQYQLMQRQWKLSRPRIVKSDTRRNYITMFTNVFNSYDYDFMNNHLQLFYSRDFVLRQKNLLTCGAEPPLYVPDDRGLDYYKKFWFYYMTWSPDLACKILHAVYKLRSDGTASLQFSFSLSGTFVLPADDTSRDHLPCDKAEYTATQAAVAAVAPHMLYIPPVTSSGSSNNNNCNSTGSGNMVVNSGGSEGSNSNSSVPRGWSADAEHYTPTGACGVKHSAAISSSTRSTNLNGVDPNANFKTQAPALSVPAAATATGTELPAVDIDSELSALLDDLTDLDSEFSEQILLPAPTATPTPPPPGVATASADSMPVAKRRCFQQTSVVRGSSTGIDGEVCEVGPTHIQVAGRYHNHTEAPTPNVTARRAPAESEAISNMNLQLEQQYARHNQQQKFIELAQDAFDTGCLDTQSKLSLDFTLPPAGNADVDSSGSDSDGNTARSGCTTAIGAMNTKCCRSDVFAPVTSSWTKMDT